MCTAKDKNNRLPKADYMGLTETFKAYLSSMILIMIFFSNVHIVIALINKVNYSNNSHPCALSATITIRVI